ncbi:unnamed protein product [Adineta ricciae]|nr:unnamed protein product [Adineta ricciae]
MTAEPLTYTSVSITPTGIVLGMSTQFATDITYALCFALDALRLNIYLPVGYFESNYFGWTLNETTTCNQAKIWYEKKQYDRIKANCTDGVLNKGGT